MRNSDEDSLIDQAMQAALRPDPSDFEIFRFEILLINKKDRTPAGEVHAWIEIKLVTPNTAAIDDAKEFLKTVAPDAAQAPAALWVLAGSERLRAETDLGGAMILDRKIEDLITSVGADPASPFRTVVISICGFEWYVLDAYTEFGPDGRPGRVRDQDGSPARVSRPLDVAIDRDAVGLVLAALVRSAPHLRAILTRLSLWESRTPRMRRLAPPQVLIQPLSANGFFDDDGTPNVDPLTGDTLVTPAGFCEQPAGGRPGFPSNEREMPNWRPYLTADPLLAVVLAARILPPAQLPLGLAYRCREILPPEA